MNTLSIAGFMPSVISPYERKSLEEGLIGLYKKVEPCLRNYDVLLQEGVCDGVFIFENCEKLGIFKPSYSQLALYQNSVISHVKHLRQMNHVLPQPYYEIEYVMGQTLTQSSYTIALLSHDSNNHVSSETFDLLVQFQKDARSAFKRGHELYDLVVKERSGCDYLFAFRSQHERSRLSSYVKEFHIRYDLDRFGFLRELGKIAFEPSSPDSFFQELSQACADSSRLLNTGIFASEYQVAQSLLTHAELIIALQKMSPVSDTLCSEGKRSAEGALTLFKSSNALQSDLNYVLGLIDQYDS